jgi:hypothetical protein
MFVAKEESRTSSVVHVQMMLNKVLGEISSFEQVNISEEMH